MYYFQCTAVFRFALNRHRAVNQLPRLLIPPIEVANPNNRVQHELPAANPVVAVAAAGRGARRRLDDEAPGQVAVRRRRG